MTPWRYFPVPFRLGQKTLYSYRRYDSNYPKGWNNEHRSIDWAAPLGSDFLLPFDAVITNRGSGDKYYGNWFTFRSLDSSEFTLVAHFQSVAVTVGKTYRAGTLAAKIGSTGYSTGPHVHMTSYAPSGQPIDRYLEAEASRLRNQKGDYTGGIPEGDDDMGAAEQKLLKEILDELKDLRTVGKLNLGDVVNKTVDALWRKISGEAARAGEANSRPNIGDAINEIRNPGSSGL